MSVCPPAFADASAGWMWAWFSHVAAYCKIDSRKLSLREFWNIGRSWKAVIPWIAGRLNISFGSGSCFRIPDSVAEMELPESEFSTQARASLQPVLDECLKLGFHSPRYYSHESLRRDTKTSFISLLHRSGEVSIRLMHSIGTRVNPPIENRQTVLLSELSDGTYFFTTDDRPKFRSNPGVMANRLIGATVSRLVESHEQRLTDLRWRNPAKPVRSFETLDDMWNRYEKDSMNFGLKRGLYVLMSPEEVAREQEVLSGAKALSGGSTEHSDVMVELVRLQNKKAGWNSVVWILVVSVALFVIAGTRQWSWDYLIILLPILFLHELGHYLAMRAFHYRNLRMFFIPFFGAAVSGQHYNVPGWKKVVVSLMGPVPGILLGAILGGIGLVYHISILSKIALVAVFLNGFNLLPLLPLDGGWVFHAVLFSRHYLFDAVFRVLAAVGLFAVGLLVQTRILLYLGIPMLLSIPASYRMGRIARQLRRRGLPPISEDAQTIPPETAQAIITEIKKSMPKAHTSRMVAEQTLQIFEMLNARPPGWAASIGLLTAHVASIGLALAAVVFIAFGHRFFAKDLFDSLSVEPRRPMVGTTLYWREGQPSELSKASITIVANFTNRAQAELVFSALTNRMTEPAAAVCLGETVLLTLPADSSQEQQWLAELRQQTKTTFMDRSNAAALFALSCRFPSPEAARAIADELDEYLGSAFAASLIPPYLPNDSRTPEQRAEHRLARQSLMKVQRIGRDDFNDPRIQALQEQLRTAIGKRDKAEMERLLKQMGSVTSEVAAERRERLRNGGEGPIDTTIVDLFEEWSANQYSTNLSSLTNTMGDIVKRMGEISTAADSKSRDRVYSMRNGIVSVDDTTLTLTWCSFVNLADGIPALYDWLVGNGASDFMYDIVSGERAAEYEER